MKANKSETALYRAPTLSLLLESQVVVSYVHLIFPGECYIAKILASLPLVPGVVRGMCNEHYKITAYVSWEIEGKESVH